MTEYKVHKVRFVDFIPQAVNCLAFEDCDSPRLAVSRQDGTIEIWSQMNSWTVDFVIPSKHGRSIESLAWSKSRLFSAGLEGEVTEWDLVMLKEKSTVDSNGGPVWSLSVNHKRNFLAAGCEDGAVRLFDIDYTDLELVHALDKQESRVLSLAWSHCDDVIVTGGADSTIRMYDVKSKRIFSRISTDKLRERSTLIWSIHLTKDMTIISGNSLGQTQFWDANIGTLLHSFRSHEADILTICVNSKENAVYSSGVDSRITEFKYIKNKNEEEWMLTKKVKAVSHDIRALAVLNGNSNVLFAGGIDPRLVKFDTDNFEQKKFKFLPLFLLKPVCHVAKSGNLLLYNENNMVHLWKLPSTETTKAQDLVPKKLLELKSSRDDYITCCDISPDGSILVFADMKGVNAYQLSYLQFDDEDPQLELQKIKLSQKGLKGIQKVKVTADSTKVIFANYDGIGYMNLDNDEKVLTVFPMKQNETSRGPWIQLETDSESNLIAASDLAPDIYLYSIEARKCLMKLPTFQYKPMAIAFQPGTCNLVIATVAKTLRVFNHKTKQMDQWFVNLDESSSLKDLPRRASKFVNIVFDAKNLQEMFLQSENGFVKLTLAVEEQDKDQKLKRKRKHSEHNGYVIKSCTKYSSLLHFDVMADGTLLVVERPFEDILSALPPALKLKKYGT